MKNHEGYTDITPYYAIKNIEAEQARVDKLLAVIFGICDLAGYKIENRIILRNVHTGRIHK